MSEVHRTEHGLYGEPSTHPGLCRPAAATEGWVASEPSGSVRSTSSGSVPDWCTKEEKTRLVD